MYVKRTKLASSDAETFQMYFFFKSNKLSLTRLLRGKKIPLWEMSFKGISSLERRMKPLFITAEWIIPKTTWWIEIIFNYFLISACNKSASRFLSWAWKHSTLDCNTSQDPVAFSQQLNSARLRSLSWRGTIVVILEQQGPLSGLFKPYGSSLLHYRCIKKVKLTMMTLWDV